MDIRFIVSRLVAVGLLAVPATGVLAADPAPMHDRAQTQKQERAFGWELMTEQERSEHRAHMRSLKTEQEREQYRLEHHKKMQERAKKQGVTLPDESMPRGMGKGRGMGGGMGSGGGMGKKH